MTHLVPLGDRVIVDPLGAEEVAPSGIFLPQEFLEDSRDAQEALSAYETWAQDPSRIRPYAIIRAELEAEGCLGKSAEPASQISAADPSSQGLSSNRMGVARLSS